MYWMQCIHVYWRWHLAIKFWLYWWEGRFGPSTLKPVAHLFLEWRVVEIFLYDSSACNFYQQSLIHSAALSMSHPWIHSITSFKELLCSLEGIGMSGGHKNQRYNCYLQITQLPHRGNQQENWFAYLKWLKEWCWLWLFCIICKLLFTFKIQHFYHRAYVDSPFTNVFE